MAEECWTVDDQVQMRIFISYRRSDSRDVTGRLADRLRKKFGRDNVFVDVQSVGLGADFRRVVEREINNCDVMLVIIGSAWVDATDGDGGKRIHRSDDLVRSELRAGLSRGISVVPVLVGGVPMPQADQLPPDLAGLAVRQAERLSYDTFDSDASRLIASLVRLTAKRRTRTVLVVAGALVLVLAVVLAIALTPPPGSPSTSPTSVPTSDPVAIPSTPSAAPELITLFTDDFSGATLDPSRWKEPAGPDHIRQESGHLVLSTRPGQGIDYTTLEPVGLPETFTDVRLTVVIPPYAQGGQGGGALVINPRSTQPQLLSLGPGANGGALVAPLTCDRPPCRLAVYEDFTEPDYDKIPDLRPGDVVTVEIKYVDARLVYLLDGQEVGATSIDPGPLTAFWFSVTSGSEESWDVQIDNLEVS